jgi:SAM-dependent methyltransferase
MSFPANEVSLPTLNNVRCPICNGNAFQMPYCGNECADCGSISVTKPPSQGELTEYYHTFNNNYHGGGRKKGAVVRQKKRALADLKRIQLIRRNGTLIDIGSSNSPFPSLASLAGYSVVAVDYIRPAQLNSEVNFIEGNLNDPASLLSRIDRKFDIVTAFYVLEHCLDPKSALNVLCKLCAPSGIVAISTPEINCFADRNALGRTPWFYPPEHIHLVSEKGLMKIFGVCGMNLISINKQEYSHIRWILRYGFGLVQGIMGYCIKVINRDYWMKIRLNRKSMIYNIIICIYQKNQ